MKMATATISFSSHIVVGFFMTRDARRATRNAQRARRRFPAVSLKLELVRGPSRKIQDSRITRGGTARRRRCAPSFRNDFYVERISDSDISTDAIVSFVERNEWKTGWIKEKHRDDATTRR